MKFVILISNSLILSSVYTKVEQAGSILWDWQNRRLLTIKGELIVGSILSIDGSYNDNQTNADHVSLTSYKF